MSFTATSNRAGPLDLRKPFIDADGEERGLNPGQYDMIELMKTRAYSRYIDIGAKRGGKTVKAVLSCVTQSVRDYRDGYGNGQYILGGPTVGSVHRNQDAYWRDICYQMGLRCKPRTGEFGPEIVVGPSRFVIFGGDNEGAVGKMQGFTASGAYVDETPKCVQSFIEEVDFRCSDGPAPWQIYTGNVTTPYHWLADWVADPPEDTHMMETDWLENRHLSQQYRDRIVRNMEGTVAYKRGVLNLWVPDEGCVYPIGPEHVYKSGDFPLSAGCVVSMDEGPAGIRVALCWRKKDRNVWCVDDEYMYDGANGVISEESFLQTLIAKWSGITELIPDPSATMLISRAMALGFRVFPGQNKIEEGVQAVNNALSTGRMFINQACTYLLRSAGSYVWHKFLSKPVKGKWDHAPDALRYGAMHLLPPVMVRVYG